MWLKYSIATRCIIGLILLACFSAAVSHASSVEIRLREAKIKALKKDFAGAIEAYDGILKSDAHNIDALNGKARVLSWMGNYDAAQAIYNEALRRKPENLDSITGIADTYAWQKDYDKAILLLEKSLEVNPGERELLIRLARYHLWVGNKYSTLSYVEKILRENSEDREAKKLKRQSKSIHTFEYYIGYYYLHINNNVDGQNIYSGLRYKPNKGYTLYGQLDYLDRFNENEVRFAGGGSFGLIKKLQLSAELGLAPEAEIFPLVSGWIELASPLTSTFVMYGSINLSHYRTADLYGISIAGEYYPYGQLALLSRFTLSETKFESGGSSANGGLFLRTTWFFNDTDDIFIYFSYGSEAFKIETIDRIDDTAAKIFGAGGTFFVTPSVGISPNFESQVREGGTRYSQAGLELRYKW